VEPLVRATLATVARRPALTTKPTLPDEAEVAIAALVKVAVVVTPPTVCAMVSVSPDSTTRQS
jgi:Sec-independent protein secretion pathway component TatC